MRRGARRSYFLQCSLLVEALPGGGSRAGWHLTKLQGWADDYSARPTTFPLSALDPRGQGLVV